ncbi:EF-hand domain-containing member C2 [Quaeritorhiza haematococci]|nr:EF-hand domain-containing member C2 [Quaeritorhiza haematococci]
MAKPLELVLRYYAYFQESIQEKREEQNRIRRVNIYFYLEDDTIHVSEPKTNNSGIPQGTLIRRHRIPRPDLSNGQHYIVSDLSVGRSITFYGREFVIVGCDEFTRKFMSSLGFHMDSNRAFPVDQYESYRYDLLSRMKPTRPYQRQLQLKKFLENDRQVLRFFCVWDDSNSMFGDMRRMVIHYFLSDDTIEIREIIQPNSGKDANTSLFLRRCRLPKRLMPIRIDGTGSTAPAGPAGLTECDPDEYYTERDFKIGAVIHLYGRPFVICDCDGFTREYYHEKYGLQDFDPVCIEDYDRDAKAYAQGYYEEDATWDINETADDVNIGHNYVYNSTAPHKVAMAAEDGANAASQQRGGSGKKTAVPIWSHVVIPEHNTKKLDFQKMMRYDGVVLRFSGQLQSKKQIDRDRRFVISVFMADDSVSIFEPPQRNSGIVGGKFLEKCRIKKPGANVLEDVEQDYYSPSDFHVGAEMEFNRHPFIITGADDYTMKFMNDHPELFPKHHQSK